MDALVRSLSAWDMSRDAALATSIYLHHPNCASLSSSKGTPAWERPRWPRCWPRYWRHELIRLQCYEGLDVSSAVYEWNYQKQLTGNQASGGIGPDR